MGPHLMHMPQHAIRRDLNPRRTDGPASRSTERRRARRQASVVKALFDVSVFHGMSSVLCWTFADSLALSSCGRKHQIRTTIGVAVGRMSFAPIHTSGSTSM